MRTPSSSLAVCTGLALIASSSGASAHPMAATVAPERSPVAALAMNEMAAPTYVVPDHLQVGDMVFDGSLAGFRAYLDTRRTTDPQLFAQLDPQVRQLESRTSSARTVLVLAAVVGLGSIAYAILGQQSCPDPQVTDPNFSAEMQTWSTCSRDNVSHLGIFTGLGVGALAAGGIAWWALSPDRADLMNLVNENNRLGHEPMRLQLGYDPTTRLAEAGVAGTF